MKIFRLLAFVLFISSGFQSGISAQTKIKRIIQKEPKLFVPETPCPKTIIDADGNTYNVVFYGGRCWMTEPLKTTHYNDGTPISQLTENTAWENDTIGGYTKASLSDSTSIYLYNGYASKNVHGLCPKGWELPTLKDVNNLQKVSEGWHKAPKHLSSKKIWKDSLSNTNSSMLNFLPYPFRKVDGVIVLNNLEQYSTIWLSENNCDNAYWRGGSCPNQYNMTIASVLLSTGGNSKNTGFPCRCVMTPKGK